MRSYTVVGTGALGGWYGAQLLAGGHTVRFLGRSDVAALRAGGLTVEGALGAGHHPILEVYDDPAAVPPSDVIVVALKAGAPNPAGAVLPALAGGATAVVTLQNGLGIEDDLAPAVGDRPLLGGLCFIAANRLGPGRVEHLLGGTVTLAQHGVAEVTDAVRSVAEDLTGAGVPVDPIADLVTARWQKLLWNIPFNTLSVVLGATPDQVLASDDGTALVRSVMDEVAAAAAATGHPVAEGRPAALIELTRHMPPYRTSMGLDARSGRPLESEVIVRRPLRAGQAAGAPMPVTEALARALAVFEARGA